jgi:hypothetical protein
MSHSPREQGAVTDKRRLTPAVRRETALLLARWGARLLINRRVTRRERRSR